jgi:hypothetical protein
VYVARPSSNASCADNATDICGISNYFLCIVRNGQLIHLQQLLLELPYLEEQERSCAAGILKVARQRSDQSLRMPSGKKGMYVEPEYYDETIRQTVFQGFRSRHEKMQFIRWMCIPYFVVEDRSSTTDETSKSDEDLPPTPHFLNSGYVNDGKYYQVAQLWILMMGNGNQKCLVFSPAAQLMKSARNLVYLRQETCRFSNRNVCQDQDPSSSRSGKKIRGGSSSRHHSLRRRNSHLAPTG